MGDPHVTTLLPRLEGFFASGPLATAVAQFMRRKIDEEAVFAPGIDPAEEQPHAYFEAHQQYCALVEEELATFLQQAGIPEEEGVRLCVQHGLLAGTEYEEFLELVTQFLSLRTQ
eukprot:EG_transcript_36300